MSAENNGKHNEGGGKTGERAAKTGGSGRNLNNLDYQKLGLDPTVYGKARVSG